MKINPQIHYQYLASDPEYSVLAQLILLLFIIILLVFIWNRKLSKLNESLNAEVAQRRRMERVHSVLNCIALAVTDVSGIEEFYLILQQQIGKLMYASNFFVVSYDKDSETISYPYFSDELESMPCNRKLGYGLTDHVLRSGNSLYVDKGIRKELFGSGEVSEVIGKEALYWIGTPLIFKGDIVGAIVLQSYDDQHVLTRSDLEVLTFLSSYVSIAVERLHLLEQGKEQTVALKESEERFRGLFEDSADATILLESQSIIECNTAAYKLLGMSSYDDLLGMNPYQFSPEFQEDGNLSKDLVGVILEEATQKGSIRFEWNVKKKSGEIFPIEVLATPISYRGRGIFHVVMRDISDRKAREVALAEREVMYRSLFNYASDAIMLMDEDLDIISANPKAVAMFRCSSEKEFTSYRPKTFMPKFQPGGELSSKIFEDKIKAIFETGGLDYEVVLRRLDGDEFYARIKARKLVISGEIVLLGTLNDITERHRSRAEIERSVSLLTATIESSADGILAVDGYGRVVAWNSLLADMWNLSEYDLNSGIVSDIFGFIVEQVNEDQSCIFNLCDFFLDSSEGQVDELVLKDGRIIERYSNPQRIGSDVVGRVWSFRDVTDRRLSEEALRSSYHQLNDIIEFLPDPTLVINNKGIVVAWNKAIETVSGVRKQDILGKGNYEYSLPFYDKRRPILVDCALSGSFDILTMYESVESKGDIFYGEVYTPYAFDEDGAYFWGVAGPLKDDSGNVVGAIECMRNVTERKIFEQELHRAKLAAEAATRAKSEFLANMSHEIRTPMNSIVGFGHLLQSSDLDSIQEEYLKKMMSSADFLLSIIDEILDFSKIEAGKLVLEEVEFELDSVLAKICNMVAVKSEQKGIEFVLSVAPNVPHKIVGDPLRLEQILTNLSNNAVKFTEKGEVNLLISSTAQSDKRAEIEFIVKDSGIGLSEDEVRELFRSFSQADASITRKYGGTGLGLAITHSLVTQMGGDIHVESKLGHGSSFSFSVSFDVIESKACFQLSNNLRSPRVLVVDDNKLSQIFIASTLSDISFDVVAESSAVSAIKVLKSAADKNNAFDLIYVPFKMSGINGLEAIQLIKEIPAINDIPVILMVPVSADEEFRQDALGKGASGFISKPVTRLSLYESLRNNFDIEGNCATNGVAEESELLLDNESPKKRVLLVEDNLLNQQVAKRMLEGLGCTVDVAVNGRKGMEALWANSYDLVLMDIQMPEMDGLTATRIIRSDRRYDNLPILAMTAHAMQGDREKSLNAGMNEHLTKPINPKILRAVLRKYIDKDSSSCKSVDDISDIEDVILPQISGIDCERGLRNIGGSYSSYIKVLCGFRHEYARAVADLQEMVKKSDFDEALVLLHSLKGVAENIGAVHLCELCGALEQGIQNNNHKKIELDFQFFSAELDMIIDSLATVEDIL